MGFTAAAVGSASILLAGSVYAQSSGDLASLVNLFIGTTNGGHVFPGAEGLPFCETLLILLCIGATLPHGMVKVGMDTDSPGNVRPLFDRATVPLPHGLLLLSTRAMMLIQLIMLLASLSCTMTVQEG